MLLYEPVFIIIFFLCICTLLITDNDCFHFRPVLLSKTSDTSSLFHFIEFNEFNTTKPTSWTRVCVNTSENLHILFHHKLLIIKTRLVLFRKKKKQNRVKSVSWVRSTVCNLIIFHYCEYKILMVWCVSLKSNLIRKAMSGWFYLLIGWKRTFLMLQHIESVTSVIKLCISSFRINFHLNQ